MDDQLRDRLAALDDRIAHAARDAGRAHDEIVRIVVTKFHPAELVQRLHRLGVRDVGENRQQELVVKQAEVGRLEGLRWHFVGQAQTNKARAIRAAASVVHTVDRARLADALERAAEPGDDPLDVFVQVNLTEDPDRGGVPSAGLEALAEHVVGCGTLRLRGIMAVAPLGEEPARAFERLRGLAERLRAIEPAARGISAGMTGDFAEAIHAGATHLRIGTAITGPRPDRG